MPRSKPRHQPQFSARIPGLVPRTLALPEGEIHYVEAGDGGPLLLIHGVHGSWTHWVANIGALARLKRARLFNDLLSDFVG